MESITQVFDSQLHFRALLTRINMPERNITRIVQEEGIETARQLSAMKPNDIKDSLESVNRLFGNRAQASRIYFSNPRIKRIMAITSYIRRCITVNRIPDIRLINEIDVLNFMENMEDCTGEKPSVDSLVKDENIKFDYTKFIKFREKIQTLMSSIRGIRGITLEYLLRNQRNEDLFLIEDASPNVESSEFIKESATFRGAGFKQDNDILFTVLRHYLTGTSGWNVISRFSREKDGRGAYLALRGRYESAAYKDTEKAWATHLLTDTFYKGDSAKHTWEKYVSKHLEAHRIFEDMEEPLTESMKIMYFKKGIRSESGLESELAVARGIANVNLNFDAFVNQLTEGVANRRSRQNINKSFPREVSSFERGRGRGRGRGRSNRGRGRSTSRGSFHSQGRGGYRPNTNSIPNTISVDGKTLYPNKNYTDEEYSQLSYSQKGSLRRARFNRRNQDNGEDTESQYSRVIKAAITDGINQALQSNDESKQTDESDTPQVNTNVSATEQLRKRRRLNGDN